ncbi:MAG: SpaA isopeptide-forming pilin-related protein [Oscillospiraceae bacterium]
MKHYKKLVGLVLALVMTAALAVTAYATSVTVDYRAYVYSSQITFDQYDYSKSTTPTVTTMTISATSSLGSGSALYHMKYADGAVAYCIEPGVHSDDSGSYREGSSASWYNLPASVQSGIALAMSLGYPSVDYGTAPGDNNTSTIIKAQKWAATQTVIWELICKYRSAYSYEDWGASPFYNCVSKSRYPTYDLWYDKLTAAMQAATMIPSFSAFTPRWCDTIELRRNAAGSYTATVTDDNEVLGDYNFAANSGSGITFTRKGNTLTITATAAAAKTLTTEKTYSATGSAYEIDPDRAVVCWYDRFGRYQALAGYTGVGRDPVKAYIKIKAVEEKGRLTINKVDADTGKALAGVTYRLYNSAGKKVADAITGADGKAVFKDLPQGKYSYQEIRAPSGYVVDKTKYQITISATALNITAKRTNARAKGSLTINKVDADTGKALAGVTYRLYNSAGKKVADAITGADGKAVFKDLPQGKYSYQEIRAPSGYVVDNTKYQITITATALNITQKRTNALAKGIITVRKVDATGAPLAGAELLLGTSTDGKTWTEVSRVTTDKTGIAKWSGLKIGVQYRITEVKAPARYTLLTEPLFTGTLDSSNRDITITACNNAGFVLPFTGGNGFIASIMLVALALMAGVYFCKKSNIKKETN